MSFFTFENALLIYFILKAILDFSKINRYKLQFTIIVKNHSKKDSILCKYLTCKIQRGCHWHLGFRSFRNWHQSNHHGHRIDKQKVEGGVFQLGGVCMVLVVGDGMGRGLGGMEVGVHRDGRQLRPWGWRKWRPEKIGSC